MAAATGPYTYTASQLKSALLARVGGQRPAAAVQAGAYGALPDVQTSNQARAEITVRPAKCSRATATVLDSALFSHSPAAAVTFRVGRDGVSEVLVSVTSRRAVTALTELPPAGCAQYTATADGKFFRYSVRAAPLSGVAEQAQALHVMATGYADVDVWSVLYRGSGFLGAVTMVGPDASERGVAQLAMDADAYAGQSLSQV